MKRGKQRSGRRPPRSLSCDGKKLYDRHDAEAAADHVAKTTGALMDAYRCSHGCRLDDGSPAWHIGHRTLRK